MKKITDKTLLKQGHKEFQPVEVDGIIYWHSSIHSVIGYTYFLDGTIGHISSSDRIFDYGYGIVAQSRPKLEGVPVVSLDSYVEKCALELHDSDIVSDTDNAFVNGIVFGYKSNPNQYNLKDIEKAIELARVQETFNFKSIGNKYPEEEIIEQINNIEVIEVDEQFNIIKII